MCQMAKYLIFRRGEAREVTRLSLTAMISTVWVAKRQKSENYTLNRQRCFSFIKTTLTKFPQKTQNYSLIWTDVSQKKAT